MLRSYPPGFVAWCWQLDLASQDVQGQVSEYLVTANHTQCVKLPPARARARPAMPRPTARSLFVHCRAADDTFYFVCEQLNQRYGTFGAFYKAFLSRGDEVPPTIGESAVRSAVSGAVLLLPARLACLAAASHGARQQLASLLH
jgi:hypothetical protein